MKTAKMKSITTGVDGKLLNPGILNIVRRIRQNKIKQQPRIVVLVGDEKVRSKVERFLHTNEIEFQVKGVAKPQQKDQELIDALTTYKNLTGVEFKSNGDEIAAIRSGKMTRLQAVRNRTQVVEDALAQV